MHRVQRDLIAGRRNRQIQTTESLTPVADAERRFWLVVASLCVAFIMTGIAQLPHALVPSWLVAAHDSYRQIWPQGWDLFSKAADHEVVVLYRADAATGRPTDVTHAGATVANLWGFRRDGYAQMVEDVSLLPLVPAGQWVDCRGGIADCVDAAGESESYPISGSIRRPSVCGDVTLVIVRPTSQSTKGQGSWVPIKAASLAVKCR
jgi:hypothetical protein